MPSSAKPSQRAGRREKNAQMYLHRGRGREGKGEDRAGVESGEGPQRNGWTRLRVAETEGVAEVLQLQGNDPQAGHSKACHPQTTARQGHSKACHPQTTARPQRAASADLQAASHQALL